MTTRHRDVGDGDPCPIHGQRMTFLKGTTKQYCPDQSHDGIWTKEGKQPGTPAFWPQGHRSFAEAVTRYHDTRNDAAAKELPVLDIDLGGLA